MTDDFIYTPATTDITIRWRKIYKWTPPSEDPVFQKKWADFRAMAAKGAESIMPPLPTLPAPLPNIIQWKK